MVWSHPRVPLVLLQGSPCSQSQVAPSRLIRSQASPHAGTAEVCGGSRAMITASDIAVFAGAAATAAAMLHPASSGRPLLVWSGPFRLSRCRYRRRTPNKEQRWQHASRVYRGPSAARQPYQGLDRLEQRQRRPPPSGRSRSCLSRLQVRALARACRPAGRGEGNIRRTEPVAAGRRWSVSTLGRGHSECT